MPLWFEIKKSQGFSSICPYDVEAKAGDKNSTRPFVIMSEI